MGVLQMSESKKANATREGGAFNVVGDQAKTAFQNDQQTNHTPIRLPAATADQVDADAKAKRNRSTSTAAQITKLLAFLREKPQTTHFLRTQGISHPGGRVNDLRKRGCEILTQRVGTVDAHGFSHINVAQYVLLKEPPQQMPHDEQGGK